MTKPASASFILLLERANLDVAEGDLAVIALQREITGVGFGKERHLPELALRDTRLEVFAAQHVLDVLHAIDFMRAFLPADDDAHVVPFAGRLGGVERLASLRVVRWLVEGVEPAA